MFSKSKMTVRVVQETSKQKVHHSPLLGLKLRKSLEYPCTVIKVCLPFTVESKTELLGEVNLGSQGPSLISLNSYMEPEALHSLHSSLLKPLGLCSGCTVHNPHNCTQQP